MKFYFWPTNGSIVVRLPNECYVYRNQRLIPLVLDSWFLSKLELVRDDSNERSGYRTTRSNFSLIHEEAALNAT